MLNDQAPSKSSSLRFILYALAGLAVKMPLVVGVSQRISILKSADPLNCNLMQSLLLPKTLSFLFLSQVCS